MNHNKYKAKTVDDNKWVYGMIVNVGVHCYLYPEIESNFFVFDKFIQVKPETVCKYIDIKDKNNKYLYENDEILINDGRRSFDAIIIYKHGRFITKCLCGCNGNFTFFSNTNKDKYMNITFKTNKFDGD